MTDALWLLLRGFVQVAPVAANTVFIARGKWIGVTCSAFLISLIWYSNVGTAAHLVGWPWAVYYASGATLGTVTGMSIARWWTKETR